VLILAGFILQWDAPLAYLWSTLFWILESRFIVKKTVTAAEVPAGFSPLHGKTRRWI
jgi:hypothetical protein